MLPLRDNVPTRHVPVVTLGLLAANVLVWVRQLTGTPVEVDVFRYGYYPCTVSGPCLPPPDPSLPVGELSALPGAFTSMFMHGGWDHIVGNMLFLWDSGTTWRTRSDVGASSSGTSPGGSPRRRHRPS